MKKILPFLILAALIAWGTYNYIQRDSNSETVTSSAGETDGDKEIGIKQGDLAPDFTLQSLQGEPVKLSDFHGKNVILNFWATWCSPCRKEMPFMEDYYKDHKNDGFTVLAVNLTSTEKSKRDVKPFMKKLGLTFPVVLDVEGKVADTYQLKGYPTSFFIDKQGVIQREVIGGMDNNLMKKLIGQME